MSGLVLGSGDLDRRDQVLLAVRPRNSDRQLAACEYYRLGEVVQHEAQGRG